MNFAYLERAVILCLGCFFLVHAVLGLIASCAANHPVLERINPRNAARLVLALRLTPCLAALLISVGVVARGYFQWESEPGAEGVSLALTIAAAAGALIWMQSLARFILALCTQVPREGELIDTSEPFLAVAGIFRPRMIASRGFQETIPEAQRDIAKRHEMAHFVAADNLKRLLMLVAPCFGLGRLEQLWARYAERAADDRAVAGDPERAALLAEVLVTVARGRRQNVPLLTSSLVDSRVDLQTRVERLLRACDDQQQGVPALFTILIASPLVVAIALVAMGSSKSVFPVIERLLHI
jgi:hypothetical protein